MLQGSAQVNVGPGKTFAGEVVTLSQGGVFVTGVGPFEVGNVVELWLLLPKVAMPIRTHARVLYNIAPPASLASSAAARPAGVAFDVAGSPSRGRLGAGVGFAFVQIAEEHLARVVRTVERLRFAAAG